MKKDTAPPPPDLPPISPQMEAFLEKSFLAHPGRWFYHLDRFAPDIEAQLVSRGLVERGEFLSKGRTLIRYRGTPPPGTPESLDMP